MLVQLAEFLGAGLVLYAYGHARAGSAGVVDARYLGANLAGAVILAVVATVGHQWGFVLLNGAWIGITAEIAWRRWCSRRSARV